MYLPLPSRSPSFYEFYFYIVLQILFELTIQIYTQNSFFEQGHKKFIILHLCLQSSEELRVCSLLSQLRMSKQAGIKSISENIIST